MIGNDDGVGQTIQHPEEDGVGGMRTRYLNFFGAKRLHSWLEDSSFLIAKQAGVGSVGVERAKRDDRLRDLPSIHQMSDQELDLIHKELGGQQGGNSVQRMVRGCHQDSEGPARPGRLGAHEHPDAIGARQFLKELRLPGVLDSYRFQGGFVNGARDQRVRFTAECDRNPLLDCSKGDGPGTLEASLELSQGERAAALGKAKEAIFITEHQDLAVASI